MQLVLECVSLFRIVLGYFVRSRLNSQILKQLLEIETIEIFVLITVTRDNYVVITNLFRATSTMDRRILFLSFYLMS